MGAVGLCAGSAADVRFLGGSGRERLNNMTRDELMHLAHELRTQDNACTADPIFYVEEQRRIYGIDVDYDPQIAWLHADEPVEVDPEEANRLEAAYQETHREPEGFMRVGYHEHWGFVQPFFTRMAAESYIKNNGHQHDGQLRVFVGALYRNHEMIALRKHLMGESR